MVSPPGANGFKAARPAQQTWKRILRIFDDWSENKIKSLATCTDVANKILGLKWHLLCKVAPLLTISLGWVVRVGPLHQQRSDESTPPYLPLIHRACSSLIYYGISILVYNTGSPLLLRVCRDTALTRSAVLNSVQTAETKGIHHSSVWETTWAHSSFDRMEVVRKYGIFIF